MAAMMHFRVRRFSSDLPRANRPIWSQYQLDLQPTDRVLDALLRIKDELDPTLTFRRSCGHGICGSDAIRINGRNALACQTLIRELPSAKPVVLEPVAGLPVVRDLVVDQEPFFAAYHRVLPYLIPAIDAPPPSSAPLTERRQSPEQLARYQETTMCVLCAACTTSCPVFWLDGAYVGPAVLVNAHRFIFDSRDGAGAHRLALLNGAEGVWRCRTTFNCQDACPREIRIPGAIAELKRAEFTRGRV